MTNENRIAQLERRIQELEGYLSQFESFKNFRKRDTKNNTAAISTTLRKPNKRGSRLREDWQPSTSLVDWVRHDFPHVDLPLESAKFVDYWVARADKGAIKLDWDRTFKNWIRNSSSQYRRGHYETRRRSDPLDFTTAVKTSFD